MKLKVFSSALALTATLFSFPAAQAQQPAFVDVQETQLYFDDIPQPQALPQYPLLLSSQLLQYYYAPHVKYSLSYEEQQAYLELIQEFWPWNYYNLPPEKISDDMAEIVNTMVAEIANCSQGLETIYRGVKVTMRFMMGGIPRSLMEWANFIVKNRNDLMKTFGIMKTNKRHQMCINSTAWYWKTPFEISYRDYY